MHHIRISSPSGKRHCSIGNDLPIVCIAGPCAIESREQTLYAAAALSEIFAGVHLPFIFKSSFDKANRSSYHSFRGVGMAKGLDILAQVREDYDIPVITDIHDVSQAAPVAEVVDCLQIPALLCRQTDLVRAAARTKKPVSVKKGQFLAPSDMEHVLAKCLEEGNADIMLCERGSSFGYNNLVVDMRSLAIMKQTGRPVVFDATHSVQLPGSLHGRSGGQREFVPVLAKAAVAVGVACVFLETHEDPDSAPCDGPNMLPFSSLPQFLGELCAIDSLIKKSR